MPNAEPPWRLRPACSRDNARVGARRLVAQTHTAAKRAAPPVPSEHDVKKPKLHVRDAGETAGRARHALQRGACLVADEADGATGKWHRRLLPNIPPALHLARQRIERHVGKNLERIDTQVAEAASWARYRSAIEECHEWIVGEA